MKNGSIEVAQRVMVVAIAVLIAVLGLGAGYTMLRAAQTAAAYPPLGRTVTVDGITLHYVDTGEPADDRATVVLVHGASSNLRDLKLALGDRLARDHRVILIDRPGYGWSARPGDRRLYDPGRQAEVVRAALNEIGVGRHVLVGHSLAGALVLAYGLAYPDDLDGVVALAPVSHPWPGGIDWYYTVTALPVLGPLFARTIAVPAAELAMAAAVRSVFAPQQPPENYIDKAGIELLLRPRSFRANALDVKALYKFVERQAGLYHRLAVPVTVMTGTEDSVVSPAIHARALGRQIAGARLVMLDGVGHMPHYAAPELVVEEIARLTAPARRRDQAVPP